MNNPVNIYRGDEQAAQNLILSGGSTSTATSGETLDLRSLFNTLRRRRRMFLLVAGTILGLAVLLTLRQTPLYTGTAQVVIDTQQQQVTPRTEQVLPVISDQSAVVDTQVEVLESSEMASKVADALQLDQSPMFSTSIPDYGMLTKVLIVLGRTPPVSQRSYDARAQREFVVSRLKNGLTVQRVGSTYALQISFLSPSPEFAAQVANEYARQYTTQQISLKATANANAIKFLAGRIEQLRQQAEADTRAVQDYRIRNNLLSTNAASLTESEVSTYNQQVAMARAQAAEDQARLVTARRQLQTGSKGDDVGEALNSGVVSSLRTQRATLAGELANLRARYGPQHPDVLKAQQQLADLDKSIQQEIDRVISNLQAKTAVSQQRLGSIGGSLAGARGTLATSNRAMVGFDDLTRKAETSQALYETYLNRYKETAAQEGTESSDSRVVSWAVVPLGPSSPNVPLNMFLAVFLALGAGVASALIAELLFSGLTTGDDVETRLGVRYLGGIPMLGSLIKRGPAPVDAVVEQPNSAFAESFRNLYTSISYAADAQVQVLLVTSALPQEGKTTTSMCLARSTAMQGERVVIVDCDTRRRTLNKYVPTPREAGLVEVLQGTATLADALVLDEASGAYILPLNRTSAERGDLMLGEAMEQVLRELRTEFTFIILDAAPILPVVEPRVLATAADAVIMIARWRKTPDHAVRSALRLLPATRSFLAGVVLTRIDMRKQSRFAFGDPSFYYNEYKSYYS